MAGGGEIIESLIDELYLKKGWIVVDKKEKPKKIPYGISDFEKLRKDNCYYVDKTRFIENIENSSDYLFFIRPRRFGKSLWLSLMECYYDITRKEQFEELFKGTYIYDNPTEEKNTYFILRFNFSEVCSDTGEVESSFDETIKLAGLKFINKYRNYLKDKDGTLYKKLENLPKASSILKHIISFVEGKGKIYLLIDEYDNFTNTILSTRGKEQYMAVTHGEGFYRHFFNVIKAGTTNVGAAISKLFITGVSPVTLDDVTSGFNIGDNITTAPGFNEMAGFTERELKDMLDYYREEGVIRESSDKLIVLMKDWYNNYLFSEDEETRMYNSDMALSFIKQYRKYKKIPKDLIDQNVKTDYNKLKYLIITDIQGRSSINGNFEKLKIILADGEIEANLVSTFPVERITDPDNFISLLYYLGLLTIKDVSAGMTNLTIPNEVIKKLYYEYIREGYRDTNIFNIDLYKLGKLFKQFAFYGKWEDLFIYLSDEMSKQTSLRDYIEGEKAIQTFLRVYLGVSNYYITKSEPELNRGFCDIMMIPNIAQYPDIGYSYLLEIKYIKPSDYDEKKLQEKIKKAKEQLEIYKEDEALKKMAGTTKLERIILVFAGVELKYRGVFNCEIINK